MRIVNTSEMIATTTGRLAAPFILEWGEVGRSAHGMECRDMLGSGSTHLGCHPFPLFVRRKRLDRK